MKEKLSRFLSGRYGPDELGQFLNIAVFILLVLGLFGLSFTTALALVLFALQIYRMLSRDTVRRAAENAKYIAKRNQVKKWFATRKSRFAHRNTYRYLHCPSCHQDLRVPKGKGDMSIVCPKCHTRFDGKS